MNKVLHNLPLQDNQFIGRNKELDQLRDAIRSKSRIMIYGIGGIGKTALVLEVASQFLKQDSPQFEAIIFLSAKPQKPEFEGQLLSQICETIGSTLGYQTIKQAGDLKEQIKEALSSLINKRTLLIVDNLETIESPEKQEILSFLERLPEKTQVIVTGREKLEQSEYTNLLLERLQEPDSQKLIEQQIEKCKEKISPPLTTDNKERLSACFQGVPLALIHAIGLLASGGNMEEVLDTCCSDFEGSCQRLFEGSCQRLKNQFPQTYKLLLSLAIFSAPPTQEALAEVAGLDKQQVNDGLSRLQLISFVNQQENRYRILPLTYEYALKELKDNGNQNFEREARERWVRYYLNFAQEHGGKDWGNWNEKYKFLEEEWVNFRRVLNWCADKRRATDVRDLWKALNDYASIYGYWHDRIRWTSWLEQEFLKLEDWQTVIYAMSSQGWTWTQMFHPEKAEKLLLRAWDLADDKDLDLRDSLAKHISYLRIRQQDDQVDRDYSEALDWLDQERGIVKELHSRKETYEKVLNSLKSEDKVSEKFVNEITKNYESRLKRSKINIDYYNAEIEYFREKYSRAKTKFEQVQKSAQEINWLRRAIYAQRWLADIIIKEANAQKNRRGNQERATDLLADAEQLLQEGLEIVEKNHEARYIAYYQRSLAALKKAQGKFKESNQFARQARESFHRLGLKKDEEKMQDFLESLEMKGITWLHLSDWHQKGSEFDRDLVRNALIQDIRNRAEISPELKHIDFIVFSGDVAYSGKKEEYETAIKEFFEPVLEATGLTKEYLFIVPGNHDLDRDTVKTLLPQALLKPFPTQQDVKTWLTEQRKRNCLLQPFEDYRNFVTNYTGQNNPDYASIKRMEINGKRVALVGLNSALMSGRETTDQGHLVVGEPQYFLSPNQIEQIARDDVKIVVLHHPFGWLDASDDIAEQIRLKDYLREKFHFILHGHSHCPEIETVGGAGNYVIISGGASYDRRIPNNPINTNAYNFVHLDFETNYGHAYLRCWNERGMNCMADTAIYLTGQFEFSIPSQ